MYIFRFINFISMILIYVDMSIYDDNYLIYV